MGLEPTKEWYFGNKIPLGQEYKNIFVRFLVQMKTVEFAFEINWTLGIFFGYGTFIMLQKKCLLSVLSDL